MAAASNLEIKRGDTLVVLDLGIARYCVVTLVSNGYAHCNSTRIRIDRIRQAAWKGRNGVRFAREDEVRP